MAASIKYLADTSALIWWFTDDPRLSRNAARVLNSEESDVAISAISSFELGEMLGSKTSPQLEDFFEGLGQNLRGLDLGDRLLQLKEIPILGGDSTRVTWSRRGSRHPFDRVIAAQAINQHRVVITPDHFFEEIGVPVLW